MNDARGARNAGDLSDAQRWRIVADWFDEAARTGDFTEDRVGRGLCSALAKASGYERWEWNYDSPAHRVLADICYLSSPAWPAYGTRSGAGFRACLALLLAHDAEDTGGNHREDA